MRRVLQFLVSAAIVIGIASCMNNDTVPDSPTTPSAQSQTSDVVSTSDSYVILSASNALPTDLSEQITAAGGTVTGEISSIGVALATSTDPNYNGTNPADVSLTNVDDDTAGFILSLAVLGLSASLANGSRLAEGSREELVATSLAPRGPLGSPARVRAPVAP